MMKIKYQMNGWSSSVFDLFWRDALMPHQVLDYYESCEPEGSVILTRALISLSNACQDCPIMYPRSVIFYDNMSPASLSACPWNICQTMQCKTVFHASFIISLWLGHFLSICGRAAFLLIHLFLKSHKICFHRAAIVYDIIDHSPMCLCIPPNHCHCLIFCIVFFLQGCFVQPDPVHPSWCPDRFAETEGNVSPYIVPLIASDSDV